MSIPRTLAAALFCVLPLAEADAFPERFEVHYTLHAGDLEVGRTQVSLAPLGDGRFEYTTQSRATGVASLLDERKIRERSIWEFSGPQIRSLRYHYERRGEKERDVEVIFDWSTGQVTNHVDGETWLMEVQEPTFDGQSHLLALIRDLASGVQPSSYRVADGGEVKTYHFTHLGREEVSTLLGRFDTFVVQRTQPDATRQTTFWFAPALHHIPVQIEHREEQGSIFVHIRSASGLEDAAEDAPEEDDPEAEEQDP